MNFKLYIDYKSYLIRFYATFLISEFSNYTVMERMHYNFAYFPIFILLNYRKLPRKEHWVSVYLSLSKDVQENHESLNYTV